MYVKHQPRNRKIAQDAGGIVKIGEHKVIPVRGRSMVTKGASVQPKGQSWQSTRGDQGRKAFEMRNPKVSLKCELMSRCEKEELGVPGRRRGECLAGDLVWLNLVMQDIGTGTKRESWGWPLGGFT